METNPRSNSNPRRTFHKSRRQKYPNFRFKHLKNFPFVDLSVTLADFGFRFHRVDNPNCRKVDKVQSTKSIIDNKAEIFERASFVKKPFVLFQNFFGNTLYQYL